jgi:hypothetical protein
MEAHLHWPTGSANLHVHIERLAAFEVRRWRVVDVAVARRRWIEEIQRWRDRVRGAGGPCGAIPFGAHVLEVGVDAGQPVGPVPTQPRLATHREIGAAWI